MALWADLGPARLEDYHELHEYLVGDMHLLASPKDLLLIEERIANDQYFADLIRIFNNPRLRKKMFARMWQFIDTTIEYKLKTKAAPFFAAWGTRGMGKSEVLSALLLRIILAYHRYTSFKPKPALGRNDSDGNTKLGEATKAGIKLVLHIDEAETEMSTGSKTEADALVSNLETIRVLMHTVLRCTIRLQKIIRFAEQCDIILHTLFQDRIERVNYCMVYIIDDMTGMLKPIGIVDVPLHNNQAYRRKYELLKEKDQEEFTISFGRTSPLRKRTKPVIERLVDYVFDNFKEHDIFKYSDLEADLVDETTGVGGDILNKDERRIAMKISFKRIQERRKKRRPDEDPDEILKGISWGTEFTWRMEIATLMKDHPEWKNYYPFFLASEVHMLKPSKHAEEFKSFSGRSVSQNYRWLAKIEEDKEFQGWLKFQRSVLHETFVVQRLQEKGFEVTEKPHFTYEGQEFEEDLLVKVNAAEVWINCKCGSGMRTYVNSEYKTTFLLHQELQKEAYILYLDLETMLHHIYLPTTSIAVGPKQYSTILKENIAKFAKMPEPSTPLILLRALAEDVSDESERIDGADTALFVEGVVVLARLSGIEAAEKAIREKGLQEATARALLQYVRQELERG